MQAVGYVRGGSHVSGQTLATQNQALLDFCQAQGYEIVATFMDSGAIAIADDYPGFRQMLDFIKLQPHTFLVVVLPSLEALGDDIVTAARRYFQLEGLGARVVSLDDSASLDSILSGWRSLGGSQRLSEKVRAAMRRRAVRGHALGRPPFGYRIGPRRRLEIVEEEAKVVRHIFHLYLQDGLGIRRIARRLNEDGVFTRSGGYWSMVSIRDILRNRAYLGTYTRFDVRIPSSHPSIITPDEFRRVQERLNARRVEVKERRRSPFLLTGLLYCGYCGNRMIGVSRHQRWQRRDGSEGHGEYRYYQCQSRTNQSLCAYHTHQVEELETQVWHSLVEGEPPEAATLVDTNGTSSPDDIDDEYRRLRERMRRLERRLELYIEAAAQGRLNTSRFRSLAREVAARLLETEEALAATHEQARRQATETERKEGRDRALAQLRQSWGVLPLEERQRLLRRVIERIDVHDNGVKVTLYPA